MKTLKAIAFSLLALTLIPLSLNAQGTKAPAKSETKTVAAAHVKHHKKHKKSMKATTEVKKEETKAPSPSH